MHGRGPEDHREAERGGRGGGGWGRGVYSMLWHPSLRRTMTPMVSSYCNVVVVYCFFWERP